MATATADNGDRTHASASVSGDVARGGSVAGGRIVGSLATFGSAYGGRVPGGFSGDGSATAIVIGEPSRQVITNALSSDPLSAAAIDPDNPLQKILLLGQFTNDGGTPSPETEVLRETSSSIELSYDLTGLTAGGQLILAFLDPTVEGAGFDSLTFRASREGVDILDVTFSNAALAAAYFDDHVLYFDSLDPVEDGVLDLRFDFDISFTGRDDNFSTSFLMARNVVPIPPAVWLFGSALGLMGGLRRSRQTPWVAASTNCCGSQIRHRVQLRNP